MEITQLEVDGYERVVRGVDTASGLHALIAVHDTTLGPSLGGMRMWPYRDEAEALTDVLRLARGMTFKSALAATGLGGGKAVLIGNPRTCKSESLYLTMGRLIDSLGGSYITAEDVNTSIADLEIVSRTTRHVTGLSKAAGGSGNPSPYTALGCFLGIELCLERVFGSRELAGRTVAIQGVGAVGGSLAEQLVAAGARVLAADLDATRLHALAIRVGVEPVAESALYELECDVFAPCALGGILNDSTIPRLRCKIVAGAANNQLLEERHGDALRQRGILYAPDYVINAGGIINVGSELLPGGYDEAKSLLKVRRIPAALSEIFDLAEAEGISTNRAANERAHQILEHARANGRARPV